jgi:UDP-galactopyranose mutase
VNELEVKSLKKAKIVIVGSGFYGCTMAERISSILGQEVTILESRNHPGGNAYSYTDFDSGIEVHKYGSHLFHTNNSKIWEYVNKFDKFNEYVCFEFIFLYSCSKISEL